MLHASPRMPVLKGVALSVALLLAAVALCHASETNSPPGASEAAGEGVERDLEPRSSGYPASHSTAL